MENQDFQALDLAVDGNPPLASTGDTKAPIPPTGYTSEGQLTLVEGFAAAAESMRGRRSLTFEENRFQILLQACTDLSKEEIAFEIHRQFGRLVDAEKIRRCGSFVRHHDFEDRVYSGSHFRQDDPYILEALPWLSEIRRLHPTRMVRDLVLHEPTATGMEKLSMVVAGRQQRKLLSGITLGPVAPNDTYFRDPYGEPSGLPRPAAALPPRVRLDDRERQRDRRSASPAEVSEMVRGRSRSSPPRMDSKTFRYPSPDSSPPVIWNEDSDFSRNADFCDSDLAGMPGYSLSMDTVGERPAFQHSSTIQDGLLPNPTYHPRFGQHDSHATNCGDSPRNNVQTTPSVGWAELPQARAANSNLSNEILFAGEDRPPLSKPMICSEPDSVSNHRPNGRPSRGCANILAHPDARHFVCAECQVTTELAINIYLNHHQCVLPLCGECEQRALNLRASTADMDLNIFGCTCKPDYYTIPGSITCSKCRWAEVNERMAHAGISRQARTDHDGNAHCRCGALIDSFNWQSLGARVCECPSCGGSVFSQIWQVSGEDIRTADEDDMPRAAWPTLEDANALIGRAHPTNPFQKIQQGPS